MFWVPNARDTLTAGLVAQHNLLDHDVLPNTDGVFVSDCFDEYPFIPNICAH